MFTGIPFIDLLITEGLMLVSGVMGWFAHSSFVTSAVSKVQAEVAKVVPATPHVS